MESSLKPSIGQDVTPVIISQANLRLLTPTVTVPSYGSYCRETARRNCGAGCIFRIIIFCFDCLL